MFLVILKQYCLLIQTSKSHTSVIQPLKQVIIATFKSYYTQRTFPYVLDTTENNDSLNLSECWKSFTVADCITLIKDSVDELRPTTLNACWHKLWKAVVKDFKESSEEVNTATILARQLNGEVFEDVQPNEVEELLQAHTEEL